VWGVAENFRYMNSLTYAEDKVEGAAGFSWREGKVVYLGSFRLERFGFGEEGNKYIETEYVFETECECYWSRDQAAGAGWECSCRGAHQ
jgi:hypothetical protein